jgi:hypothetical protein
LINRHHIFERLKTAKANRDKEYSNEMSKKYGRNSMADRDANDFMSLGILPPWPVTGILRDKSCLKLLQDQQTLLLIRVPGEKEFAFMISKQ